MVALSPERRDEIERLLKEGLSVQDVAEKLGCSTHTARRIRKELGIPAHKTRSHWIPKDVVEAIVERLHEKPQPHDTVVAKEFGVDKTIIGRVRKKHTDLPALDRYVLLDASKDTRERIAKDDEVSRLTNEIKRLHREQLDNEAYRTILGVMGEAAEAPPKWVSEARIKGAGQAEVPVTMWADWHLGEVVRASEIYGFNEFTPAIADRRVRYLVQKVIALCRDYHNPSTYPGLIVNLAGDTVSGGIHPELAKTDAESRIEAALHGRDLLIWAIDSCLEYFKQIFIACAAGNHARDNPKPEFKRYVRNSFDWLIYQLLIRHYENNPHVTIMCNDTNEAYYRVFDQRYLLMHGDMMGVKGGDGIIGSLGPIARGEVKVGKQQSAIGRDFDRLLIGHWHREIPLPNIMVSNTLKGFDEYAKNALRAVPSTPSQPLWFCHPHRPQTSYWNVTVEDPKGVEETEWVSVPANA